MIDFVTTSILRPDVLRMCYASFDKNLLGLDLKDCRLFLNIDPLPSVGHLHGSTTWPHTAEDNIRVASEFFGEVVSRAPENFGMSHAVKWAWPKVESEFIFLLEDDWEMTSPVSVENMIAMFKPGIQQVRLCWEGALRKPHTPIFGLSPGLVRKTFCHEVIEKVKDKEKLFNPERYIRNHFPKFKGIYYPKKKAIVRDIGAEWKFKNRIWIKVSRQGRWEKFVRPKWKKSNYGIKRKKGKK